MPSSIVPRSVPAEVFLADAWVGAPAHPHKLELAALVRFARRDVPVSLAQTDPALYRCLREQVTRFFLLGGDVFSLQKLEEKTQA